MEFIRILYYNLFLFQHKCVKYTVDTAVENAFWLLIFSAMLYAGALDGFIWLLLVSNGANPISDTAAIGIIIIVPVITAILQYFVIFRKKEYLRIIDTPSYGTTKRKIMTAVFMIGSYALFIFSMYLMAVHNSGGLNGLHW